jgi:hypothetical protein
MLSKTTRPIVYACVSLCLTLNGCSHDKPANQDPALASLPQLPDGDLARLKGVDGKPVLATGGEIQFPAPPPPAGVAAPKCAARAFETDYSGKASYSVFYCGIGGVTGWPTTGTTTTIPLKPSYSIDYSRLSAEQRGVLGTQPTGGVFCSVSKGPWSAEIKSQHECSGTCDAQNQMTLTDAPKLVVISWIGALNPPPAGVEFVGSLKPTGTFDNGPCHPGTQLPPPI